jgi:hypothetical protein
LKLEYYDVIAAVTRQLQKAEAAGLSVRRVALSEEEWASLKDEFRHQERFDFPGGLEALAYEMEHLQILGVPVVRE